jgi:hypothetical protein
VNRDPIGEKGGLNVYGFVGNGPIDLLDAYGLMTVTISVLLPHGSIEWDDGTPHPWPSYFSTDHMGANASQTERHGSIYRRVTEGNPGIIIARERTTFAGMTGRRGVFRRIPLGLQLSTSVNGIIKICECCSSGKIRLNWRVRAAYSSGRLVSGGRASYAWIVNNDSGHYVRANVMNQNRTLSGVEDFVTDSAGCISVGYGVGAAWVDRAPTMSTKSSEKVIFKAECAP